MHGFQKSPSALFYKQTLSLEIRKSEGSPHKSISISQLTHVYGRILLISIFLRNFIQQQHLRNLRPITKKMYFPKHPLAHSVAFRLAIQAQIDGIIESSKGYAIPKLLWGVEDFDFSTASKRSAKDLAQVTGVITSLYGSCHIPQGTAEGKNRRLRVKT
jgi:hypothetical protein